MAGPETQVGIIQQAVRMLARPFVRFCLRHSFTYQDLTILLKVLYVQEAEAMITKTGKKANVSRLSVLTGVHRPDVTKIFKLKEFDTPEPTNMLSRIVGHWRQTDEYRTKSGEPRVLSCKGTDSDFHQLVKQVNTSINPGTVLFELERIGVLKRTPRGVALITQGLGFKKDPRRGFELLAKDVDSLISAAEENLLSDEEISNLHIRTEYDNIFYSDLPKIREWFIAEGKAFHRKSREFLAQFDKDINQRETDEPAGAVVSVGAFSLTPSLRTIEGDLEQSKEASAG